MPALAPLLAQAALEYGQLSPGAWHGIQRGFADLWRGFTGLGAERLLFLAGALVVAAWLYSVFLGRR